ncbi:transcription activator Tec1p [[Candida] railenensis]|uniref:Transcription activator Tec1p n=1 Tax=[Candida] railenensis TaxID=45579 RepID=A0A9P0QME9_9ASCO|nr:transcription activator Tec1p [[Candida] railenensis]
MIVDIAIGDDGKQLYQVHESSKVVRKEMPRSTNFTTGASLAHDEEKTPIRKILGTISPSTLNQKKLADSDFLDQSQAQIQGHDQSQQQLQHHEQYQPQQLSNQQMLQHQHQLQQYQRRGGGAGSQMDLRKNNVSDYYISGPMGSNLMMPSNTGNGLIPTNTSSGNNLHYPMDPHQAQMQMHNTVTSPKLSALNTSGSTSSVSSNDATDIWSTDVEAAFEEVLSIIPKNGLSKIKISGRSCGRNELISDYIFQKTGKFRTRKQVSSHIQVIKNLGQKQEIIKLINDGPIFNSEQERDDNMNKFEEIFSKITLAKSMGVSDTIVSSNKRSLSLPGSATTTFPPSNMYPKKRKMITLSIENFYISIQISASSNINNDNNDNKNNDNNDSSTLTLTRHGNVPIKNLKLKEDANLSTRFPGLNDFTTLDIPFLHNMVNMKLPILKLSSGFNNLTSNYLIRTNLINSSSSIFSCVFSFGQEVLKTNEVLNDNENASFMFKFWNFFFKELLTKDESDINTTLKGVTIKQIIYESDTSTHQNHKSTHLIPKSKIQAVLLWEFAAVQNYEEAYTTTSRLSFPKPIHQKKNDVNFGPPFANDIVPQSVGYQPYGKYPQHVQQQQQSQSQRQLPQQQSQQQQLVQNNLPSNYSPTSASASSYVPSATSYRSTTSSLPMQSSSIVKGEYGYSPVQPDMVKPQLSVQHKFQSLQEMHQLNPYGNSGGVSAGMNYAAPGVNNGTNYMHPSVGMDLMNGQNPDLQAQQQQLLSHHMPSLDHSNPQSYQFGGLLVNPSGNNEQAGYMNMMDNTYVGK